MVADVGPDVTRPEPAFGMAADDIELLFFTKPAAAMVFLDLVIRIVAAEPDRHGVGGAFDHANLLTLRDIGCRVF